MNIEHYDHWFVTRRAEASSEPIIAIKMSEIVAVQQDISNKQYTILFLSNGDRIAVIDSYDKIIEWIGERRVQKEIK